MNLYASNSIWLSDSIPFHSPSDSKSQNIVFIINVIMWMDRRSYMCDLSGKYMVPYIIHYNISLNIDHVIIIPSFIRNLFPHFLFLESNIHQRFGKIQWQLLYHNDCHGLSWRKHRMYICIKSLRLYQKKYVRCGYL